MSLNQNNIKKADVSNLIPCVFIIAFLLVGFIPNLDAVDKIAPQWLYLSVVNILGGVYLIYKKKDFLSRIVSVLNSYISIFYILFFLWAALSFFYALNSTEVLVNLARHSNTLFMYLHLSIFIYNIKNKNFYASWLITIILFVEVYSVFNQAIGMIELNGFIDPGRLKGVTANRNITAFSIALKIPFVLYLLDSIKNRLLLIFLMGLVFFSILDLSMISSRASFIAVGLILLGHLFAIIYKFYFLNIKDSLLKIIYRLGHYVIPLIFALIVNQVYFSSKGVDAISRAGTIAISTSDDSISKRLRYYEDVLNHMSSNPIFGIGIGNWKLESIKYDRLDIDGYIVPYHAHSDFIQLGAELGFIGFFLYLGIFLSAIYFVFIVLFKSKISNENKIFSFFLIISLGVYLIDANLNFPIARPQELAPWALVMSLISFYYLESTNKKRFMSFLETNKLKYLFPMIILLFSLPALSITNQTYKSHIAQFKLLQDFNSDSYNVSLNDIETFIPNLPNITVTTIPMDAIKARYYFHYKKFDKALELLEKSNSANPYLSYSDALSSVIYKFKGDTKNAKAYAKKAFYNLPKNAFHISEYMKIIRETEDIDELEAAFKLLTRNDNLNGWKNYLVTLASIQPSVNEVYKKRAKKALDLFPEDPEIKVIYKNIVVGKDNVEKAVKASNSAQEYFNKKDFERASQLYDLAIEYDRFEYSYYENAAIAYYSIQDYDRSLLRINVVVNEMNPLNGKCEYIKGLNYLQLGLIQDACNLFRTSLDSGYEASKALKDQYCKN